MQSQLMNVAGVGLLLTTTSVVDAFSIRPAGRQLVVGSLRTKSTKLYLGNGYLNSLPDLAVRRESLTSASQACLDGLNQNLAEISGMSAAAFDNGGLSAFDQWAQAVDRSTFDILAAMGSDGSAYDPDVFFFASMEAQPDVAVASNNIVQEGVASVAAQVVSQTDAINSNNVAQEGISTLAAQVVSQPDVAAAATTSNNMVQESMATLTAQITSQPEAAQAIVDNNMAQESMSTLASQVVEGVSSRASEVDAMQSYLASITPDFADLVSTNLADGATINSIFAPVSEMLADSVGKVSVVLDAEKVKLVEQSSEVAKQVGDKHVNELAQGLVAGIQALGKFLMLVLDVFLKAVSGQSSADLAAGAKAYLVDVVNHAIQSVSHAVADFGNRSVVDVISSFVTIVVQVVTKMFEITNTVIGAVTGKELSVWVSEWSLKVSGYIQHESTVLMQKASAAAMNFGERSVSEIIAFLTAFLQAVGRIMAEGLSQLGGVAMAKGQIVATGLSSSLSEAMTSNTVAHMTDTVHMVSSNMM